MRTSSDPSIRDRLLVGAGFLIGASVLSRLLAIGSISILGRVLGPADFGVLAYAWLIVELQRIVCGLPFVSALIRIPEIDQSHINTVFSLCFTLNLIFASILFFGADGLAALLGKPELAQVISWLAIVPLVDSVKNPRFALLARELRFDWPAKADVISRLAMYALAIPLAWILKDYWAMVIGLIASAAVSSALTHYATPGPLGFGLQRLQDCLSFGAWRTAYQLTNVANKNLSSLVLGATLGLVSLGAFRMGTSVIAQMFDRVARSIDGLIFAGIAKKGHSVSELRTAYLDAQSQVFGFLLPVGVGTALCAPEFLRVLVGPQWNAAVPVLQILGPAVAIGLLGAGARGTLTALGDVRSIFVREVAVLLFILPAVWIGVSHFGLIGAAAATGAAEILGLLVMLRIISKHLHCSMFDGLWQGWRSIVSCALMSAVLLGLDYVTEPFGMASATFSQAFLLLVTKASIGAIVYASSHVVLWHFSGRPRGTETVAFSMLGRLFYRVSAKLGFAKAAR